MNIIFDNIIFALQRFGGISVVWSELLKRATKDNDLQVSMLDYNNTLTPRWMERYREPEYTCHEPTIFHSSYFRIINQPQVKNVTTIHDLTYHYYRKGLAKQVHLWQEANALMHSAEIICVSKNTRKDVLALYPKLDEKHVHVVYNGVSEAFTRITCANITPYETRGYLLYVGNRSATYKNFVVVVEVAYWVHLPLVIVGSALTKSEQELLNSRLGRSNYWVKIYPNQTELVAIYNHAYCLIYPSAYEGFGLPIIEAQRTGCLVIGQTISSVPEVMSDGGICVPSEQNLQKLSSSIANEIRSLLNGRTNANDLIEKGKHNSERFSWDKTYEQTKRVYQLIYN